MQNDDALEYCWIDVNGFGKTDWEEIRAIATELKSLGYFKSDDFKCIVAATALYVTRRTRR